MIKFIEETHTYLLDGVIVPSVSTILGSTIFKDKYKGVNSTVLNAKREFGKNVHKAIETGITDDLTWEESLVYDKYIDLIGDNNIEPVEHEQIVHYNDRYAGTFDMIALYGEAEALGDVKTTAALDIEYLSWQLSMYELAYCKMYDYERFDELFAIWIPKKGNGKVVKIKRKTQEEIMALLDEYEKLQAPLPDF